MAAASARSAAAFPDGVPRLAASSPASTGRNTRAAVRPAIWAVAIRPAMREVIIMLDPLSKARFIAVMPQECSWTVRLEGTPEHNFLLAHFLTAPWRFGIHLGDGYQIDRSLLPDTVA